MYKYDLDKLSNNIATSPVGHLVYVLYVLTLRWMGPCRPFKERLIALGALNEAQHELRRLHLADYEDGKIQTNGEAV